MPGGIPASGVSELAGGRNEPWKDVDSASSVLHYLSSEMIFAVVIVRNPSNYPRRDRTHGRGGAYKALVTGIPGVSQMRILAKVYCIYDNRRPQASQKDVL
jgi:hypothetical protein